MPAIHPKIDIIIMDFIMKREMTISALAAERIFDGEQFHTHSALVWDGKEIVGIAPVDDLSIDIECADLGKCTIAPGFIDLQVNGGGGVMFNQSPTPEGINTIIQAHRQHGSAYCLPTLISDTMETMAKALTATQHAIEENQSGLLGVHLEGPWLSQEKKGAHDPRHFFDPKIQDLVSLPWLNKGVTLVTLAPEEVNNRALKWLDEQGVIISCGHSNADFEVINRETKAHIHGFTHLYNAMSVQQGRFPGVVGGALSNDEAWCSVIADGHHVHPHNILMALRNKPKGKLFIVTDAMASVGNPKQNFVLNGNIITLDNGKLIDRNGNLAGAHIGMDESVNNLIHWGVDEMEALKMASTYPAYAIRMENELGYLKQGYRASATVLDDQGQTKAVLADGELIQF